MNITLWEHDKGKDLRGRLPVKWINSGRVLERESERDRFGMR